MFGKYSALLFCAMGALKPRMNLAMQADGCRENWLQAEIMMHAKNHHEEDVWTNCEPILRPDGKPLKGQKYDFAAYDNDDNPVMVAELKIMSGHFLPKCLFGARAKLWRTFGTEVAGKRVINRDEIESAALNDWGLIPDAARLLRGPAIPERYLMMVLLDLVHWECDSERVRSRKNQLHDVMDRITFDFARCEKEKTYRDHGFKVRMWRL